MKVILITGITGFTGSHLVSYLWGLDEDIAIIGTPRRGEAAINNVEVVRVDITKPDEVRKLINIVEPDYVFHLAACNRGNYKTIYTTNVLGTINLLEAIKDKKKTTKILLVGSIAEYGMVSESELPIQETTSLRPINFYGNSKVSQELLGFQYYYTYGLSIVMVRPTNIIGPGQSEDYVCSNFAKQIVEIEKGKHPNVLKVGNLEAQRDFIDVRDTIDAYWRLLNSNSFGKVFNVCSGKYVCIKDVLDCLLTLTSIKPEIRISSERFRTSEIMFQSCSYSELNKATSWVPQKTLRHSLKDILEYWRSALL